MDISKEELIKHLEEYKGILNKEIVDYLNSIIELEFSVVRDYISEENRKALSELEIYKKASIYNIYNKTINLINSKGVSVVVTKFPIITPKTINMLIPGKLKNIKIFTFENALLNKNDIEMFYKHENTLLWNINLYQTIEDEKVRQDEIKRLYSKIEYLKNIGSSYLFGSNSIIESPNTFWVTHIKEEIFKYRQMIEQLQNKKIITDEEKEEIDIRNEYYELLLEDYGLSNNIFMEEETLIDLENNTSMLNKTLYKRIPSITIKNNIKYI